MPRSDLNPILGDTDLSLFDFDTFRPVRRGNTATVYLTKDGRASVVRPSFTQQLRTSFRRYEIDTAHHPVTLRFEIPSTEETFNFRARMYMTWAVFDPLQVARFRIRDAQLVFWPFLQQRLRPIGRQFGIEQSAMAEAEINNDLKAAPFQLDRGIELSFLAVDLELDDPAKAHLTSHTATRRATERAREEHELEVLRKQHAAVEAKLRHESERHAATHELLLKRQRMEFYHGVLDQGSLGFLVLQLIEHPDDIKAVVEMLQSRKDAFFKKTRDVMLDLIGGKLVNAADLDPVRERAVHRLQDALDEASFDGRVAGNRRNRKLLTAESARVTGRLRIQRVPPTQETRRA